MSLLEMPPLAELPLGWSLLSGRVLAIVLWTGLGLLTVSLLILMRTRWGQARPLSKCVALSVFVHILLMGYAYGTRLFYDAPPGQVDESIQVNITAAAPEPDDAEPREPREMEPWERFVPQEVAQPEASGLARPAISESSLPAGPQTDELPPSGMEGPPRDGLAAPEPERPAWVEPVGDVTRVRSPGAAAQLPDPTEPSEAVGAPQPVVADAAFPQGGRLPRLGTSWQPGELTPEVVADIPADLFQPGRQVQQLAERVVPTELAEAVAAEQDRSRETQESSQDLTEPQRGPVEVEPDAASSNQMVAAVGSSKPVWAAGLPQPDDPLLRARQQPVPRRLGDGAPLPSLYQLRVDADRLGLARRFGGDEATEAAVAAALQWLATNQSADGRWDVDQLEGGIETRVAGHDRRGAGTDADTGITGLALLAFLAAGESHLEGKYRKTVQHGLEYLVRNQKSDGNLAGPARLFAVMYCHGMASLALSEAYAMTGDQRLRPFVERAVGYTVMAQHATSGGWRYQPGDQGDMSQFGWQVMALKSAELAGIPVPERTYTASLRFLRSVSSGRHGGLASYRQGEQVSRTMTAEALACRCFLGLPRETAAEQEAASFVLEQPASDGQLNLYYCYYAALALFQVQGEAWEQWQPAMRKTLLDAQRTSGPQAGSWDPHTVWGRYGGRAFTTAMAALCLEVYYRYLPLYLELPEPPAP
ncbi:MAG: hypothetical protein J5I93_17890 [Pirellulaceae bacterium]|nr:hypothetical protein [Pirellulaceae bacterium]